MASYVIYNLKKKSQETKEDIIIAAAKIIKSELRDLNKTMDEYPTLDDMHDIDKNKEWVPDSLQILLHYLIPSTLKKISIGQCITQASRPRSVMCPIVFGLGVQVEKTSGSKWVLNHLHKLRYSISSDEVLRYKQSAIESTALIPAEKNRGTIHSMGCR